MSDSSRTHDDGNCAVKNTSHGLHQSGGAIAGSNFVRAIDRKARSYLRTLERSFSSSSVERCEDPSFMTIEFLQARLQAQRADYKLEKQRSQQLARKVLELQERLKWEVQLREKQLLDVAVTRDESESMVSSAWEEQQELSFLNEAMHMNDSERSSQEGLGLSCRLLPKDHVPKDEDYRCCDVCSEISSSSVPNDSPDDGHISSLHCHYQNQNVGTSNFHLTGLEIESDDGRQCTNHGGMMKCMGSKCEGEDAGKSHDMGKVYPLRRTSSSIIPRSFDSCNACFLPSEAKDGMESKSTPDTGTMIDPEVMVSESLHPPDHHIFLPLYEKFIPKQDSPGASKLRLKHPPVGAIG